MWREMKSISWETMPGWETLEDEVESAPGELSHGALAHILVDVVLVGSGKKCWDQDGEGNVAKKSKEPSGNACVEVSATITDPGHIAER